MPIHVKLDSVLAERGMTMMDLSEKINIPVDRLQQLRSGGMTGMRFESLSAMCDALECQPGDLLVNISGEEYRLMKKNGSGSI